MGNLNVGNTIKNYKIVEVLENKKVKVQCLNCGEISIKTIAGISASKGTGCRKCWKDKFVHNEICGKKFGCITVIKPSGRKQYRNEVVYLCKCDCGNEIEFTYSQVKCEKHICCIKCRPKYLQTHNGSYKHGETRTQLHQVWQSIKRRCYDKNNNRYYAYGGRGIKVCDEWLGDNGYVNFRNWALQNGYKEEKLPNGRNELTIDRIDVNGNYEPSNCRWVDNFVQANNTTKNRYITYNNETHSLKEWSRILNVPYHRIQYRTLHGMSFEDAIKDCNYKELSYHTLFGERHKIKEIAEIIGCSTSVVSRAITKKISLEDLYYKKQKVGK